MSQLVLAVDKDVDCFKKQQVEWKKRDIEIIRVDYMQEAIEKVNKHDFLFIGINADNINYMPLLRIMRDIASIPILLFSAEPPGEREAEAINEGADAFVTFPR